MKWRSLAIRGPLVLFLLFGTCAFAKKKPPAQPVNINTATSQELPQVPGIGPAIGPATAEKILAMRKSYGPFKSVDDLRAIRGLGPKAP
jgi:competence ComEA-like helix-hairpin-helix protein